MRLENTAQGLRLLHEKHVVHALFEGNRAALLRLVAVGKFPAPVFIHKRRYWFFHEVDEWKEARPDLRAEIEKEDALLSKNEEEEVHPAEHPLENPVYTEPTIVRPAVESLNSIACEVLISMGLTVYPERLPIRGFRDAVRLSSATGVYFLRTDFKDPGRITYCGLSRSVGNRILGHFSAAKSAACFSWIEVPDSILEIVEAAYILWLLPTGNSGINAGLVHAGRNLARAASKRLGVSGQLGLEAIREQKALSRY